MRDLLYSSCCRDGAAAKNVMAALVWGGWYTAYQRSQWTGLGFAYSTITQRAVLPPPGCQGTWRCWHCCSASLVEPVMSLSLAPNGRGYSCQHVPKCAENVPKCGQNV